METEIAPTCSLWARTTPVSYLMCTAYGNVGSMVYEIQIKYQEDTVSMQTSRGKQAMILTQTDVFGHKECCTLTMEDI